MPCDFTNIGLRQEARRMIGNTVWYIGGSYSNNDITAPMFYERERGTAVFNTHDTSWVGKIGLMYPSDYGYATSGGTTTDRTTCLNKELYNWDTVSDCFNNDWLYDSSNQRTITPYGANNYVVFTLRHSYVYAAFYDDSTASEYGVRPVTFLKSNIKIVDGDGSSSNPYQLSE